MNIQTFGWQSFLLSESYGLDHVNINQSFIVKWHDKEDERARLFFY